MNTVVDIGFDYAVIDADGREDVRDAAIRIKLRMSRTVEDIIEIGRDLIAVKKAIGHGHFLRWIETEFRMGHATASNFMNVAEKFGDKFPTVGNMAPSILYALAAPRMPDAVVEEVIERVEAGEPVTRGDVQALKEEWASERKDLKQQLKDQKLKVKDAAATKDDFAAQLSQMRGDLAKLRDERDTIRHEMEMLRRGAVGDTKIVEPIGEREAVERQVAALMAAWNKASAEARQEFLDRIDTPVFDRSAA